MKLNDVYVRVILYNLSFNKMTMTYCKEQRKNLFYDLSRQIVMQYIFYDMTYTLYKMSSHIL